MTKKKKKNFFLRAIPPPPPRHCIRKIFFSLFIRIGKSLELYTIVINSSSHFYNNISFQIELLIKGKIFFYIFHSVCTTLIFMAFASIFSFRYTSIFILSPYRHTRNKMHIFYSKYYTVEGGLNMYRV